MPLTSRQRYFVASGLVLCLALWLRVTQLYTLPVFGDETDHLYWSQEFSQGGPNYPLLMDGKFGMGILVSFFQPYGPGSLWIGRAVVGLFALLSVTACIYLGRALGARWAGVLAGLFYAILPQAVHHERQMLADPLMATFGAIAIVFTWILSKRGQWRYTLAFAFALAASIIAKLFGGLYLAYPGFAWLILSKTGQRTRSFLQLAGACALGGALVGGFLLALQPRLGYNNELLVNSKVGFVHCPPLLCQGDLSQQMTDAVHTLPFLQAAFQDYFGWPLVILSVLAWPLALPAQRRGVAWLFLSGALTLIALVSATGEFPPRYIFFVNVPLVSLGALGIYGAVQRVQAWQSNPIWKPVVGALLIALTLWPMNDTLWLVWAPRQALLAPLDALNFSNGYFRAGFKDAADYVTAHNTQTLPAYVIVDKKYDRSFEAYVDRRLMTVTRSTALDLNEIGQELLNGRTIYLVDDIDKGATEGTWLPFDITELGRYFYNDHQDIRLSQVVSAQPSLREGLFRHFFTLPEAIKGNYADLANALPVNQPLILLVYPPNQAPTLAPLVAASHPQVKVIPIGDSWPLNPQALDSELTTATAGGGNIAVAFLEETKGDPHRLIESWLTTHLFVSGQAYYGPVRLVNDAGSGVATQTIPVTGKFGDAIQLDSVEVLDSAPPAGGLVRLRLTWRALEPITEQYKVFTHIFAGDKILAQHDGQPVGELRPTTTWNVGETIIDQFAIQLPSDAPTGNYQLRIGVYDLNTQARLPLILPDGSSAEFFVGGTLTLK